MKKRLKLVMYIISIFAMLFPTATFAWEGDNGYEGGISSGYKPGETKHIYDYQEVCFITGEPIVFKGTLTIAKSPKGDSVITKYTYTNMRNIDKEATLTRSAITLSTKRIQKDNGQIVEETTLTGSPTETVKVGDKTYTIRPNTNGYNFTRSNLIDVKPAINYFAGNTQGRKVYQTGTGTDISTVTVTTTGSFYGYDQYWGTTQTQTVKYVVESVQKNDEEIESWGGTATVNISSTVSKQLRYVENLPQSISFEGGYVQTQYNNSILQYTCTLPEFDSEGNSTDYLETKTGSLKLETFPNELRLVVPSLNHIRGHWAENDIKILYSLEVFKGGEASFNPQQYMTRGEFAAAVVQAAREVPVDPALAGRTTATRTPSRSAKQEVKETFRDVPADSTYFQQVEDAYRRGLITGRGDGTFGKDDLLTFADAIAIFIRSVGLENLAPGDGAVTTFKDNDKIPYYARKAAYVGQRIGLIRGDDRGYMNPGEKLTKARAAALLNRFITYMRDAIKQDYRSHAVNY